MAVESDEDKKCALLYYNKIFGAFFGDDAWSPCIVHVLDFFSVPLQSLSWQMAASKLLWSVLEPLSDGCRRLG